MVNLAGRPWGGEGTVQDDMTFAQLQRKGDFIYLVISNLLL